MTIAIACFCVAAYFIAASLVGKLLRASARRTEYTIDKSEEFARYLGALNRASERGSR